MIQIVEMAKKLFGEQRYFSETERKLYKQVTESKSKDLGVNVFDLVKNSNKQK